MNRANLFPGALRTEYRIEPLGVDTPAPRLSWQLIPEPEAGRGLRQVAYHILVASERTKLTPGAADYWDSGTVLSAATVHVRYAGRPLTARTRCWWVVRSCTQTGLWSDWSEPASWTMGMVEESRWSGKWIGSGDSLRPGTLANTLPDVWLRKDFSLSEEPTRGTAFVASVGFHELYVNGIKAGDGVLAPHVTDNSKRARYVAYEIGPLLRRGQNVLGLWLGTGWSIFSKFVTPDKPRAPIALGQFEVDLVDGSGVQIVTNSEWKTHPSPSMLIGAWDFRDFGGELYDANREMPEWCSATLDDSRWAPAVVFAPKLTLSAEVAEPNLRVTEMLPLTVEQIDGTYRFDFGRNFAGCFEIAVAGVPGDRIEIQFSERADRPMTHQLHSVYIVGPSGEGVFRNRFNYGVGRWVTLRGLRRAPVLADLRAWMVRPAYSKAAAFTCSSPLLNDIFNTTLWTFENLTLGGYVVDCPHRERMGYGGDAYATTATGLCAYQLGAFYTKWSEDWRDVQGRRPTWGQNIPPGQPGTGGHEEGNLPYTAPTYWGGGGPAWSGYCVQLPWEMYRRYGDVAVLESNFATVVRWLAFLETKATGDLLLRYGGLWDFLGDWLWPDSNDVNGDTRETLFFNNCYWIYNLQIAAGIAGVLGHTEFQEKWTARADEIRHEVHTRFFNPSDASYVNGFQAYLAIALLAEVPPPELRAAVWRRLEHEITLVRRGHIHAGITGGAMLFQLLMEEHRDDLIYLMVNREDAPGWGAMLRAGATTFWEAWGARVDSLLHSSFLFVGAWFIHGVLGIQPDPREPGFRHFVIRPGVLNLDGLDSAEGHYDSICGRIEVAWRKTPHQFELQVHVPPNTEARVYLPVCDATRVAESGHVVLQAAGVTGVSSESDETVIEVSSGDYSFTCNWTLSDVKQLSPAPVRPRRPTSACAQVGALQR